MEAFKDMVKLARPGAALEHLADNVLVDLMRINAIDHLPTNILEVLTVRPLAL